jgi:membrane protease YdiL (CAAX protease family)
METTPIKLKLTRIFYSPTERRLRAGWRLLVHFFIMLVIMIIAGFCLGLILFRDFTQNWFLLFSELIAFIGVTASVYLARQLLDHRPFSSLGLTFSREAFFDLLFGISLAGLLMGTVYTTEWGFGWLTFQGFSWEFLPLSSVISSIFMMLILFILVGWTEEFLFRGYQMQNLADGLNLTWGVCISSVMFAAFHLANPNMSWNAVVGLVAAGFFLAFGYVRTRQLWLPIGLHIGWNFFEGSIFGYPVSGLNDPILLIRQTVQGPKLLTGGAFGPEAGIIILPVLSLGALAIYLYTQRRYSKILKQYLKAELG